MRRKEGDKRKNARGREVKREEESAGLVCIWRDGKGKKYTKEIKKDVMLQAKRREEVPV